MFRYAFGSIRMAARCLLVLAAIVVAGVFPGDTRATSFALASSVSLSDSTPGANADATINFSISQPDARFQAVIGFTPVEFVADTATLPPLGAIAARRVESVTLGLIGLSCSTGVDIPFNMMIASTDINDVLPGAYGKNFGRNPGPVNDQFDILNGLPLGVTKYPDYLNRILVDGSGNPLQPGMRLYGQSRIAGIDVSLSFAQFGPGAKLGGMQLDPALGAPWVAIFMNSGDPAAAVSPPPITDYCTPLAAMTTIYSQTKDNPFTPANEAGVILMRNPSDGAFNFTLFAISMPDADDDGIENALDPCPFTATPGWDPRDPFTGGDSDRDGLPDGCDPEPAAPDFDLDADNDRYVNRGDNCPMVVNGLDAGPDGIYGTGDDIVLGINNQGDVDTDGIGDACDPNPFTPDGHMHAVCNTMSVNVGAGGTPMPAPNLCAPGVVGIDLNNNGVFDSLEPDFIPVLDFDGDGQPDVVQSENGDVLAGGAVIATDVDVIDAFAIPRSLVRPLGAKLLWDADADGHPDGGAVLMDRDRDGVFAGPREILVFGRN